MSYGLWIYFVFGIVGAKNLSPVDCNEVASIVISFY